MGVSSDFRCFRVENVSPNPLMASSFASRYQNSIRGSKLGPQFVLCLLGSYSLAIVVDDSPVVVTVTWSVRVKRRYSFDVGTVTDGGFEGVFSRHSQDEFHEGQENNP